MSQFETIKVKQEGKIFTVQLHRPEERNAINMQMVNELSTVIKSVYDASDISVFIIRGLRDVFSSGIDLHNFTPDKQPDIYGFQKWEKMCSLLHRMDKLTIAAVEGECNGGAYDLLLLCDIRLAEKKALFKFDEIKMGFIPGMTIYRLAKYVGLGRAKSFIFTSRQLKATEAMDWGVIDHVADIHQLDEMVNQFIDDCMPFHPVPNKLVRRLLDESYSEVYEDFLGHYLAAQHRAINSDTFLKKIKETAEKDAKKKSSLS